MIILEKEIDKLIDRGVIIQSSSEEGEFISPIFLLPKEDSSFRMILNLKKLNDFMPYIHFKMDTFDKVLKLIRSNQYMCKIDIKDAYYSVAIQESDQKLLKFGFQGKLYKFKCLPNGLCSGPRKFTKLLKPVLAFLRQQGYIVSAYIDDIIIIDESFDACISATVATIKLLDYLGFVIQPVKSVFVPTQCITYLGFIIDSTSMRVTLSLSKSQKVKCLCSTLFKARDLSIRNVATVIGSIVSCFPAVKFGPLHYRALECVKINGLKCFNGDFDSPIALTKDAYDDLKWWIDNIDNSFNDICIPNHDVVLTTDASLLGWGAVYNNLKTRGVWNFQERQFHINVLELKAILFGVTSLVKAQHIHIKILTDSMNAVHSIRNMGSCRSPLCNAVVKDIWSWAISNSNWLSVSFIPGIINEIADRESRNHVFTTEWKIDPSIFEFIVKKLNVALDIDLFASRVNYQFKPFASLWPDPEAIAVDSFTFSWSSFTFYAFPPFAIIPHVLQKIALDNATGLLIIPDWPNSPWFKQFNRMLISECLIIPSSKHLLQLPSHPKVLHPLQRSLHLRAGMVSGIKHYQ